MRIFDAVFGPGAGMVFSPGPRLISFFVFMSIAVNFTPGGRVVPSVRSATLSGVPLGRLEVTVIFHSCRLATARITGDAAVSQAAFTGSQIVAPYQGVTPIQIAACLGNSTNGFVTVGVL